MNESIGINSVDTFLYSGIAGVLLGSLVSTLLNFWFQEKLLNQQLRAQERLHQELLEFQQKQGEESALRQAEVSRKQIEVLETTRHVLRDLTTHIAGLEGRLSKK